MPSRKDRFGFGVTIPATTARVVDTAVEILGDPDPDEMAFLHSVLAQTFLPECRISDIRISPEYGLSHIGLF